MQIVEKIPFYLRFSSPERELARHPEVRRAIDLAKAHGWHAALETVWDASMVAYSGSQKRWNFLEAVPFAPDMTVLEIGIGFGQHTAEIASKVAQLDTLEVKLLNAIFAKLRCEQEHIKNVSFTCGGDDCRLPFSNSRYDVVLLNLVFEWCASELENEAPEIGQRRLLSEIYRILKPGGLLQLNTKNRFSYRLLTGGPDEHTFELPFGSALPRWLLRLILKAQGRPRPPGYLYSWWALRSLLHDADFTGIKSYWTVPEMRFPDHIVEANAHVIRMARKSIVRQGESRRTDLLMKLTPAGLIKYFAPGLFFVARK